MSSAQAWTLIAFVGTLVTGLLAAVGTLHSSLRSSMGDLRAAVEAGFRTVGVRFEGIERRLDNLDRDVQALSDRVFRDRG